ncbi:unnamed protein product [Rangifer tarandus platyrhynchus]|uniref:Uncharacterized protein n=1 Tax=Rangifer tarandus platyrhynchus TaxID=3082113 RepID=A0AC59ZCC3_RANTA
MRRGCMDEAAGTQSCGSPWTGEAGHRLWAHRFQTQQLWLSGSGSTGFSGLSARVKRLCLGGSTAAAPGIRSVGSAAVALQLRRSAACGMFPGQGPHSCPLRCPVE